MAPLISIIIPVYNVEPYVLRCFHSVVSQTYQSVECIVVDDCGTDGSMQIVSELIQNYQGHIQFRIVRHEQNKGLSAARNTGTRKAQGQYLFYLDSDDMLMPDSIELLAKPLQTQEVDFVIGNYSTLNGTQATYPLLSLPDQIIQEPETIQNSYLNFWYMMAWNKLVNRHFLIESNLFFIEGIVHEDDVWSYELACLSKSMAVVNSNTYYYHVRESSLNTKEPELRPMRYLRVREEIALFTQSHHLTANKMSARILQHYESLLFNSIKKQSLTSQYRFFKDHIHCEKFSTTQYNLIFKKQKLRYIHHIMPTPLAFIYLKLIDFLLPSLTRIKHVFSPPVRL